ncbi:hypothetical protein PM8797T_16805 [Gimesia maris DSM 8797]|nr:hypothetical protein PM8797T_16805 [Gimesia maris DSM 8797]
MVTSTLKALTKKLSEFSLFKNILRGLL